MVLLFGTRGRQRRKVVDSIKSTNDVHLKKLLVYDYVFSKIAVDDPIPTHMIPYHLTASRKMDRRIADKIDHLCETLSSRDVHVVDSAYKYVKGYLEPLRIQKTHMQQGCREAVVAHNVDFHKDDHDFLVGVKEFVYEKGLSDPLGECTALQKVEKFLCFKPWPEMWRTLHGADRTSRECVAGGQTSLGLEKRRSSLKLTSRISAEWPSGPGGNLTDYVRH